MPYHVVRYLLRQEIAVYSDQDLDRLEDHDEVCTNDRRLARIPANHDRSVLFAPSLVTTLAPIFALMKATTMNPPSDLNPLAKNLPIVRLWKDSTPMTSLPRPMTMTWL